MVPSSVGTSTVVPSAASGAATSTTVTSSSSWRTNRGSSLTRTWTYRSPAGPPRSPAWPRPVIRMRWPSSIPAGTSTDTLTRSTLRPRPPHSWHGVWGTLPSPWQTSHTAARTTWPKGVREMHAKLTGAVAVGAGLDRRPGLCAVAAAVLARRDGVVGDLDRGAVGGLDERDLGPDGDVAALDGASRPAAPEDPAAKGPAAKASAAEEGLEDVGH